MRAFKFFFILLCLTLYLCIGAIIRLVLFWANSYTVIRVLNALKYYLMHTFKAIAGLKVTVSGKKEILKEKGIFVISTHVGYLDGVILGSLIRGSFTTKEEIKKVPLLGKVVAIGGSIFIDRKKKHKILEYVNHMSDRLNNGINIFNFPEGHATDGKKILSFFPAFFEAPLKTKSSIVPITIDYERINGRPIKNYDNVYCYDGRSILKHLWNFLSFRSVDISVKVHSKVGVSGFIADRKGRKAVSELCSQRLSAYKNLPISLDHPFKRLSPSRRV